VWLSSWGGDGYFVVGPDFFAPDDHGYIQFLGLKLFERFLQLFTFQQSNNATKPLFIRYIIDRKQIF